MRNWIQVSLLFGQPDEWPCPVVPVAVNVVQYPVPSGRRCLELGKAIRRALDSFDDDLVTAAGGKRTTSVTVGSERRRVILIDPEDENKPVDEQRSWTYQEVLDRLKAVMEDPIAAVAAAGRGAAEPGRAHGPRAALALAAFWYSKVS